MTLQPRPQISSSRSLQCYSQGNKPLARAVNPYDTTETRQEQKETFLEQTQRVVHDVFHFFQPIFKRLTACIPQALVFFTAMLIGELGKQSPNSKTLAG
jgi:hypothetical protein